MTCDVCGCLISILNAVRRGEDEWICEDCDRTAKQRPHPDACHCDECEAIRFAYCGYE